MPKAQEKDQEECKSLVQKDPKDENNNNKANTESGNIQNNDNKQLNKDLEEPFEKQSQDEQLINDDTKIESQQIDLQNDAPDLTKNKDEPKLDDNQDENQKTEDDDFEQETIEVWSVLKYAVFKSRHLFDVEVMKYKSILDKRKFF